MLGAVFGAPVGCSSGSAPAGGASPYAQGPLPGGAAGVAPEQATEGYFSRSARMRATGLLLLPGFRTRQLVHYEVIDGMAVMEGDILLGPVSTLAARFGFARPGTDPSVHYAVGVTNTAYLWPGGIIPYEIDGSVSATTRGHIQWAVVEVSQTQLTVRPRTAADNDYVVFRDTGTGCNSYVGRIGGAQTISTTGCSRGSIAHEILHAAGFHHEHSRSDRDQFVTIVWSEIASGHQGNFEKLSSGTVNVGSYDYASIMHYDARAFSKSGRPTIEPFNSTATIGQRQGLSVGDKLGVSQLYGTGQAPAPGPSQPVPPGMGTAPAPTGPPASGSFSGNYVSQQGNVTCNHSGAAVHCTYPAGALWCTASGNDLSCAWSGSGGQGRAAFQRQPNGVLAGTWGDALSVNSRGAWDLTPDTSAPAPPAPTSPFPFPWPTGTTLPPLPFPVPVEIPWLQ